MASCQCVRRVFSQHSFTGRSGLRLRHHQKSPAVKCPAPFHNTAAPQAAVPMAMLPPIFFLYQRLLALSSSSFHRGCPRTSLEVLWREARASSCDRGSSAETTKHPFHLKTPRDASEGIHPTIAQQNHKKKTTEKNVSSPFPTFEP